MENKMQPAEIAETLLSIFDMPINLSISQLSALQYAAEIVRNHDVVHAEWTVVDDGVDIGDGTHTECSNCKIWARVKTPYCPHCGSKMDGGNKYETD